MNTLNNEKNLTADHIEFWCDADRRGKRLRETPAAARYCPTIGDVLDAMNAARGAQA